LQWYRNETCKDDKNGFDQSCYDDASHSSDEKFEGAINMFIRRTVQILIVVVLAFAFASVTNAFAAANTVPTSYAGDGANTISGYTVANVHYNLNAANPQNIDSVTFTVNAAIPAGSTVQIKLVAASTTFYSCTVTGGTSVSCTTTGATVTPADELRVIIAQ
jgi:hypothetical protein